MKKSSCRGLPTTVAGIDRVACGARSAWTSEHRVVVLQRVVAVVIAERALRAGARAAPPRPSARTPRWRSADADGRSAPATCGSRSPAISDASISSGTFSGSGAIADRISAGGPPRNTVTGSGSFARLGARVVEAAALADLPVHAGRRAIVDLHAGTCRGCGPACRDAACRRAAA